jgi:hypothetical protein
MHIKKSWSLLVGFILIVTITQGSKPAFNQRDKTRSFKSINDEPELVRWFYGLSLGGYFANSSTANYYNGTGEHSVETALFRQYNFDRIVSHVDQIIESFEIGELPLNMKYNPAIQIGFFGGLNLSRSFAFTGEFNYTKLSITDRFTLITDRYSSLTEPIILLGDIYGTEERIELRLGVQYTANTKGYIHPFLESGINITDIKVIENRVRIQGLTFSIREIRTDYYNIRDYGMGFGIFTGAGLKMEVSDSFAIRIGGSVSFSRINLGENKEVKPQYTAFLRINLNEVF